MDRTFLYRHRDLLAQVHAAARVPSPGNEGTAVARASLHADLANALARNNRLHTTNRLLERRLSEALGTRLWAESGLGAPPDIDRFQQHVTSLEQRLARTREDLKERTEELEAARATNRELTRALNHAAPERR